MREDVETKVHTLGSQLFVIWLLLLPSIASAEFATLQSNYLNPLRSSEASRLSGTLSRPLSPLPASGRVPSIVRAVVTPSQDSFVDILSPITNFGGLPVLIVQATPSVPVARDIAYLKFTLTDVLPTQILLVHAKPSNASLSLYVRLTNFLYNASVDVRSVASNDWTEGTIDWENMPSIIPTDSSTARVTANGTWARWDVAKIVGLWLSNSSEVSLALTGSSVDWKNYVWFDSRETQEAKGITLPRLSLVFVEPYLRFESQYAHLQISIANQTFETDANGNLEALIPWGTYSVSVPQVVPLGEGQRAVFENWGDGSKEATRRLTIGNNMTLTLNYGKQYQLTINSSHSATNGSGWYFSGTEAKATVPNAVPVEGWLGLIGVRYVFSNWEGACTSIQPECTITMDGPRTVTAVWISDYTVTLVGVSASVIVIMFLATRWRKTGKSPHRTRR